MNREEAINEIRRVLILNSKKDYPGTSTYFADEMVSYLESYWSEDCSKILNSFVFESYGDEYFIGYVIDGKKDHFGAFKFANGDIYIGGWDDDKITDDESFYFFSDGRIFLGELNDGLMHGSGILYLPEGKFLRGNFVNGEYKEKNSLE